MESIYSDLLWLPKAPPDFAQQLKTASTGSQLRQLASYRLDNNQLARLAKALASQKADLSPLIPTRMGILSNAITQLIIPGLIGTALRYGFALEVAEAEFNQIAQTIFSQEPVFAGQKLDSVLVAIDYRGLPLTVTPGNTEMANQTVSGCLDYLRAIVQQLHRKTGAQVILQNIVPPAEHVFGSYETRLPGTLNWLISMLNHRLDELVSSEVAILDVAGLASNTGLEQWHDHRLWHMAKAPFNQKYVPIYAEYVCRILAAKQGKSRRCLIMDLDNTLWGGIIGDDGMEGIVIGHGDATGEAHLSLQQTLLALRERGIVLAISSKNEDAIARQPFREHPDMAIREEHIAVFQANWSDKASNIRAIARSLSLGLESMVFLDDNPAERAQVRRELPEVAVPELPEDPAYFARTLLAAGYFEAITFSQEDQQRADFYQKNAQRTALLEQSSDMEGYLKSLNMVIDFKPFDAVGRARIAQLVAKSNQFNLTTKRYSEAEIKGFEENPDTFTLQVRLEDSLGDNGMISVIICHKFPDYWEIDTWLMSCRVLGRRVEEAVLQEIIRKAKAQNVKRIIGYYSPTPKNIIVKQHYEKLGFSKTGSDSNGTERWELEIADLARPQVPMTIRHAV